ncbi:MAG: hypothetical protein HRT81_17855, partial [Henriciella sp.]|nr:hypothetical protein [Henriciella sp.]
MLDEIQKELERTGRSLRDLGQLLAKEHRGSFAPLLIRALLNNRPIFGFESAVPQVLAILGDLPDATEKPGSTYSYSTNRAALTPDMVKAINAEFDRTQQATGNVARQLTDQETFAARNNRVGRWRRGDVETVPTEEWYAVMAFLAALPEVVKSKTSSGSQQIANTKTDHPSKTK